MNTILILSSFGMLQVWYDPEGYHSLPAYLNSLNNFLLRVNMSKYDAARHGKVIYIEAPCIESLAILHVKMCIRPRFLPVAVILWYVNHRSLKGV